MKNLVHVVVLAVLVLLTACSPSGYSSKNPWQRDGVQKEAEAAPGSLDVRDQWLKGQPSGTKPEPFAVVPAEPGVEQPPLAQQTPGFGGAPVTSAPGKAMKVAILIPMSGGSADVGNAILNAAQLALFDTGITNFELMPRDTKGTAEGAREAAMSAVSEGAQLILGPLFADEVRAAAPVAQSMNISMVAFTTDFRQAGGNTYIMGFMPFGQVARIAYYAAAKGLKHVGVIAPQGEYGDTVLQAWNMSARPAGLQTVDVLRFRPNDPGLAAAVQRFSRQDARKLANGTVAPPPFDAIFLPAGSGDASAIANLLTYYDLDAKAVKRLGTGLWDDPAIAREQNLDGGWFAAPDPKARIVFEKKYRDAYGQTPPRLASLGYDATALAVVLAKTGLKSGPAPAFNREAITNPNGFAGIDGIFRFRPDGLAERGLAILELRNSQSVVIDPAPRTFQGNTQ